MAKDYPCWVVTFSGGKDSMTTLSVLYWAVSRSLIAAPKVVAVLHSDTGQEYPWVEERARSVLSEVSRRGWFAETVRPEVHKRFYPSVLGRGVLPVHPGFKGRWCTRQLKVDPMLATMRQLHEHHGKLLVITGVREGESKSRDAKIEQSRQRAIAASCSQGGECGLGVWLDKGISDCYDALPLIVHWKECQVFDWLRDQSSHHPEYRHDLAKYCHDVYRLYRPVDVDDEVVQSMRFGCVGCPAVQRDKTLEKQSQIDPKHSPLLKLYTVWTKMRWPGERKIHPVTGKLGPLTMPARKRFRQEIASIEQQSGIRLISPEEDQAIVSMWQSNIWPRGWDGTEPDAGSSLLPLVASQLAEEDTLWNEEVSE